MFVKYEKNANEVFSNQAHDGLLCASVMWLMNEYKTGVNC